MWEGWSLNLTTGNPDFTFICQLPSPPLFSTTVGEVVELVFWSTNVERWIHAVAVPFPRKLPPGHVQITLGDMPLISELVRKHGVGALRELIHRLEGRAASELLIPQRS